MLLLPFVKSLRKQGLVSRVLLVLFLDFSFTCGEQGVLQRTSENRASVPILQPFNQRVNGTHVAEGARPPSSGREGSNPLVVAREFYII